MAPDERIALFGVLLILVGAFWMWVPLGLVVTGFLCVVAAKGYADTRATRQGPDDTHGGGSGV